MPVPPSNDDPRFRREGSAPDAAQPRPGEQVPLQDPTHELPWPAESDPARAGERFAQGAATGRDRDLARSFERSNEASQVELGREFADPHYVDDHRLADAFADPNATDDRRLGEKFIETNSSFPKPPLKDRVHAPHLPKDAHQRKVIRWIVIAVVLLFVLVLVIGCVPRMLRNHELDKKAEEQKNARPVVDAARVLRSSAQAGLAVPGTTTSLTEAYVYARANGYLKQRFADIGDHVKKGQLLAVIDAPDLDQQVDQAREQLRQSEQQLEQQKAQLALATVTVQRYRVLVNKGVLSRQEGDQQETNYASQQANVAAAARNVEAFRANLRRVIALQSFEQVRAPFDGVITQRTIDVGALIGAAGSNSGSAPTTAPIGQTSTTGGTSQAGASNNAGSSGNVSQVATPSQSPGQGGPLFAVADERRLRILVSVPEGYVTAIHAGGHAEVAFQEYPGVRFNGDITRTADSVDPNTRTMLTEVQVDNRNGKLYPGMYAVATFPPAAGGQSPLMVTGDAIAVRHDQSMVAKIENGKVRFVPVTIGRDFGNAVEILNGLQEGDMVATNITDDVTDDREVNIHEEKSPEQKPAAPPAQNQPLGGSTQYGNQGITDRNLQGAQAQQNNKGSGGQQKSHGNSNSSGSKQ